MVLLQKYSFEKQHATQQQKETDQFKLNFYTWTIRSGIARAISLLVLLLYSGTEKQDIVLRRIAYSIPCFIWNAAYAQVLGFFCSLYFSGIGGDWQKCFNISFNFSMKLLYGIYAVCVIDVLFRQDEIYFFSNALIIVATTLLITICSLIFFAVNIGKMISGLSDYENMIELVKVKNKTQRFSYVIGFCYFWRITYFYIYAFGIRSDDSADDSWIIILDVLMCEIVSYMFSLYHKIDIGQNSQNHSLEMQNYIPTPFLEHYDRH